MINKFTKPARPRWAALIIILAAFGLRLYLLEAQSLRGDESLTHIYSIQTLSDLYEIMGTTSPHPPVFYTAIHFWLPAAGSSEFGLRFLPLAASVALTAAAYAFGRTTLNVGAGLLFALLITLNPYQIFYAQDARSYTLVTLFGVLSTIAVVKALQNNRRGAWFAYGLFVTAGMYTHYYFPFIVIFQGLYVIWRNVWRKKQIPRPYVVTGIIVAALYLPWFLFSLKLVTGFKGSGETVSFAAGVWRPLLAFSGGQFVESQLLGAVGAVTILSLALGLISLKWQPRQTAALLLLYLFVPLLGIFTVSLFRPIFNERYLIIASPAYIFLVGSGFLWLLSFKQILLKGLSILGIIAFIWLGSAALNNYYHNPQFAKSPPWREALNYISDKSRPGDALIYTSPVPSITYYNNEQLPTFHIPQTDYTTRADIFGALESLLTRYDRLWYLPAESFNPVTPEIEPWLDKYSVRMDETYFRLLHLNLYQTPDAFLANMLHQPTRFGDNIYLDGFRVSDKADRIQTIEAGQTLDLTLVWRAEDAPSTPYTVFTHLAGPDGLLYGQWDNQPGRGLHPTTNWEIDTPIFDSYRIPVQDNAPPGNYRLLVGMYNPETGERLPVIDEAGNPVADHITLAIDLLIEK